MDVSIFGWLFYFLSMYCHMSLFFSVSGNSSSPGAFLYQGMEYITMVLITFPFSKNYHGGCFLLCLVSNLD